MIPPQFSSNIRIISLTDNRDNFGNYFFIKVHSIRRINFFNDLRGKQNEKDS